MKPLLHWLVIENNPDEEVHKTTTVNLSNTLKSRKKKRAKGWIVGGYQQFHSKVMVIEEKGRKIGAYLVLGE